MFAFMFAHVNQLTRHFDRANRSLNDSIRLTNKCHNRTIRRFARINIQQTNTFYRFDAIGDLFDDVHVISFGEVGDAFDELFHKGINFSKVLLIL
jgi:hypothetical protein